MRVNSPFEICGIKDSYDAVEVTGGGPVGQSEAIMYAIAKSLASLNEGNKKTLKAAELLTRDAELEESKKYGRKKARKRFSSQNVKNYRYYDYYQNPWLSPGFFCYKNNSFIKIIKKIQVLNSITYIFLSAIPLYGV